MLLRSGHDGASGPVKNNLITKSDLIADTGSIPAKQQPTGMSKKKKKLIAIILGLTVLIAGIVVIAVVASGGKSKPPKPPTPPGPPDPTYSKVSATTLKEILKVNPTWTKFEDVSGIGSGRDWLTNQWNSDNYGGAVTNPVNSRVEEHDLIQNNLLTQLNGTL